MEEVKSNAGMWGMGGWNAFNTLLGAAGLATGVTALGVKANASDFRRGCGGNWGGYGFYNDGCCDPLVNRYELQQSQRISELESGKETDAKLLEVYKAAAASDQRQDEKFAQLTKQLTDYVISNNREVDARFANVDKQIALNAQAVSDNFNFINYKIDANDRALREYVDCKTIPLQKKLPLDAICPKPLEACAPVVIKGQVINTDDTDTSNTVVGSIRTAQK